jgi:hypothetical protein
MDAIASFGVKIAAVHSMVLEMAAGNDSSDDKCQQQPLVSAGQKGAKSSLPSLTWKNYLIIRLCFWTASTEDRSLKKNPIDTFLAVEWSFRICYLY